jgi:hypothetical protein
LIAVAKLSLASIPTWVPWVGAIVVVGALGGVLGVTGVLGHPIENRAVIDFSVSRAATAYACPGGVAVAELHAGDRVLAVARSADESFLGVRNPSNLGSLIWLDSGDVTVDDGEADPSTLPLGACPTVAVELVVPQVTPVAPAPVAPGPVAAPPDQSAPSLSGASAGTPLVCTNGIPPTTDTISVSAADNVGVAGVSISWSGTETGSASMNGSGGSWSYSYDPVSTTAQGAVNFSMQARDAAGNLSNVVTVTINQNQCVI